MRLNRDLFQYPIAVQFAGLKGHTVDMIRQGWELSLVRHMEWDALSFMGYHKGLGLRCQSATLFSERMEMVSFAQGMANYQFPVMIEAVAREVVTYGEFKSVCPQWDGAVSFKREMFETASFGSPFASGVGYQELKIHARSIDYFAQFNSVEDKTDILVSSKELWTIEKHLEEIRKIQEPKQAEIRKRVLDEKVTSLAANAKIYLVG